MKGAFLGLQFRVRFWLQPRLLVILQSDKIVPVLQVIHLRRLSITHGFTFNQLVVRMFTTKLLVADDRSWSQFRGEFLGHSLSLDYSARSGYAGSVFYTGNQYVTDLLSDSERLPDQIQAIWLVECKARWQPPFESAKKQTNWKSRKCGFRHANGHDAKS